MFHCCACPVCAMLPSNSVECCQTLTHSSPHSHPPPTLSRTACALNTLTVSLTSSIPFTSACIATITIAGLEVYLVVCDTTKKYNHCNQECFECTKNCAHTLAHKHSLPYQSMTSIQIHTSCEPVDYPTCIRLLSPYILSNLFKCNQLPALVDDMLTE